MSQLNSYQLAVLAELNIDTFKVKSTLQHTSNNSVPDEISTGALIDNTLPANKIDHLARIKSAIGLTSTNNISVHEDTKTSEVHTLVQSSTTQIELDNIQAQDLTALLSWFELVGLTCQQVKSNPQTNNSSSLFFNQTLGKPSFRFNLSQSADRKAFWQLVTRMKFE